MGNKFVSHQTMLHLIKQHFIRPLIVQVKNQEGHPVSSCHMHGDIETRRLECFPSIDSVLISLACIIQTYYDVNSIL